VIKSDTAQAQGGFQFASRLGNDHDWLGAIEHSSGPGCVLATQSNVDASGEVPLGVFGRIPHVEDLGAGVSRPDHFVELDGMKNFFQIFV
jgi:hypothetical protein